MIHFIIYSPQQILFDTRFFSDQGYSITFNPTFYKKDHYQICFYKDFENIDNLIKDIQKKDNDPFIVIYEMCPQNHSVLKNNTEKLIQRKMNREKNKFSYFTNLYVEKTDLEHNIGVYLVVNDIEDGRWIDNFDLLNQFLEI
jgi:hypothetical protein